MLKAASANILETTTLQDQQVCRKPGHAPAFFRWASWVSGQEDMQVDKILRDQPVHSRCTASALLDCFEFTDNASAQIGYGLKVLTCGMLRRP